MSIERKLIGTTDAATSSAVYVEDVFSTWLYSGNSSSQTIANGIDLATKGGLVWTKARNSNTNNALVDTVRGRVKYLSSNLTISQAQFGDASDGITSFNTDGYSLGADTSTFWFNYSSQTYASWTFRKQAKFFDVVTYTGNGSGSRSIAHSLGVIPGFIMIKKTSASSNWIAYCSRDATSASVMRMNTTDAQINNFLKINNSSSTFMVQQIGDNVTGVSADNMNDSGATYVAYLFADSNSGGFGPAGTDSVVACGSYTGNGSATGPTVTLGWEPQWLLVKGSSLAQDWFLVDNMRGMPVGTGDATLSPNSSAAEAAYNWVAPTATGFQINSAGSSFNGSGETYIYLAIRRGPMRTPTDATKVFAPVATLTSNNPVNFGFSLDAIIQGRRDNTSGKFFHDKLRGLNINRITSLNSTSTSAEYTFVGPQVAYDVTNTSMTQYEYGSDLAWIYYAFRRAPGFFDVVCYTGTGSAMTISHGLGVVPEMIITKRRTGGTGGWYVYHVFTGANNYTGLNITNAVGEYIQYYTTTPTSTSFAHGDDPEVTASGSTYVAYLFATCQGVSKVGSYTGNGSSQTIDCGFASGARFVLIKRTDSTGDWWVYDSARGIVAANDPALRMNSTAAEVTSADAVDPQSSGFIVNQEATCNINVNGGSYIYLSIA